MKEGDVIQAVVKCDGNPVAYGFQIGQKFVAGKITTCNKCNMSFVDIGLPYKSTSNLDANCLCGNKETLTIRPTYQIEFFRVIEPEYRTVEISSEIKKQELQLN